MNVHKITTASLLLAMFLFPACGSPQTRSDAEVGGSSGSGGLSAAGKAATQTARQIAGQAGQLMDPADASQALAGASSGGETPSPETLPEGSDSTKIVTSYNELTAEEAYVLIEKGTERAGIGEYTDTEDAGIYICRQCNAQLYRSDDKFHSGCGWPSFDDEIEGAVERHEDRAFGMVRTEIVCSNCKGHLGHVFNGERMTEKNTRHCVNSLSMRFVAAGTTPPAKLVKKSGR
ncbi:MAG: methionine-R-sulfoxide reductase [Planctomycetota bacterium]